jgi:hypothetical protein
VLTRPAAQTQRSVHQQHVMIWGRNINPPWHDLHTVGGKDGRQSTRALQNMWQVTTKFTRQVLHNEDRRRQVCGQPCDELP